MQEKVCTKCKDPKPLSQFWKKRGDHDSRCRSCVELYRKTESWRASRAKSNARYQSKPNVKLAQRLRDRLRMATRNIQRAGSAVRDLGCTLEEFRAYIESKFQPGMTWDNWSRDGWHLDHIKPLSSFDLSDPHQFLIASHYTNLQPLWSTENFSKGARTM